MKRVYVAGCYSANNVITVLDNMRKGIRMSTRVLLAGFSVFSPWLDYHFTLALQGDEKLTVDDYYGYSISWLEVSDIMLVLPGYETSKGTLNEISVAKDLDIPIYYSFDDLIKEVKP